ncbi:MAG: DNA repair protein RecO [Saprospiraceae bacterium]|nr:DNA repair protein RecO [Bacteroidia bacterium]NNE16014.1 DNA repair protein RecO [Saprospiraceae bacterium]NNL90714.1 DNA repair protein RecO [Saprospiraceae bacterium]
MSNTHKYEGIIFKSLKYSESSLILDIYTKEAGLLSFIVSGVRKAKSRIANVFHPMNIINLIAYYSEDKLSRIKEGNLNVRYEDMSFNVIKSSIAMFVVDLSRNAIQEKEANEELYTFLKTYLCSIDDGSLNLKYVPLDFSIRLSRYLGFEITNNYTVLDKYFDLKEGLFVDRNVKHNYILNETQSLNLHHILNGKETEITKAERNDLLDHIINYYQYHIEGFRPLKSLAVLRAVLS